jgi:cobalamin biosynthetic protein CobC
MILTRRADEPVVHGGDLGAARRLFPDAPEPFLDLSTGINPNPYPLPRFPADLYARLPDPAAVAALATEAARAYGAPSADHVVAAPGSQILLPIIADLVPAGRAAILTPGYPEHTRAAGLAGHSVTAVGSIENCSDATLVILGNPNNPDGRLFTRGTLANLVADLRRRRGLLVIDEAFMDAAPAGLGFAGDLATGNVVVLRSFGKFFGLAGVRLGFALAAPTIAARIRAALGPWAVSGPALAIGTKALADTAWIARTRKRLEASAKRLDSTLATANLDIVGGTALFRLVHTPAAQVLLSHLGRAGIWVRAFPDQAQWLRFGLPANEREWRRLNKTIASFRETVAA